MRERVMMSGRVMTREGNDEALGDGEEGGRDFPPDHSPVTPNINANH